MPYFMGSTLRPVGDSKGLSSEPQWTDWMFSLFATRLPEHSKAVARRRSFGAVSKTSVQEAHSEAKRLFGVAKLSIFMIGLGFGVRTNIAANIQQHLFDPLDQASSASMLGEVLGLPSLVSR
jgi:hypothetical protein